MGTGLDTGACTADHQVVARYHSFDKEDVLLSLQQLDDKRLSIVPYGRPCAGVKLFVCSLKPSNNKRT